jgi:hypothetical protein
MLADPCDKCCPTVYLFCAKSSLRDLFGGFPCPELSYGRGALELAPQWINDRLQAFLNGTTHVNQDNKHCEKASELKFISTSPLVYGYSSAKRFSDPEGQDKLTLGARGLALFHCQGLSEDCTRTIPAAATTGSNPEPAAQFSHRGCPCQDLGTDLEIAYAIA